MFISQRKVAETMKTTYQYNQYWDYQTMTKKLEAFYAQYPEFFSLESLGETSEGKSIWCVTLSKGDKPHTQKPAFYIDANIHAGEVTGSMCAMYVIDALCTNHQAADINHLLTEYTYYIIPKVSPDGSDWYLHTSNKLRSVNKIYPKPIEKGLVAKDLDGDGIIRMMRIQSKQGAWKVSPEDPRLMIGRLPQDVQGPFYHVVTEGEIVGDFSLGIEVAKNAWGYDFNRNFPFGWFEEIRQPGSGEYPLIHTETKVLADFVLAHPNIGFTNTLHTTGGVFIYPPGTFESKKAPEKDMNLYKRLGDFAKTCTGYGTENVFDAFLVDTENYSSGAFDDWCYQGQGIPSFTIELWDVVQRSGLTYEEYRGSMKPSFANVSTYTKVLEWVEANCEPDTFKNWETFEHPQLGTVEIGGFDFKFIIQNPPETFLSQEVEKVGYYLVHSAACLPKLEVEKTEVEAVADGIYRVAIQVCNTGYMPTYLTEMAVINKKAQPIKATLLGDVTCLSHQKVLEADGLEGFSGVSTGYGYDGILTSGVLSPALHFEWLIKGESGQTIEVEIHHDKAGTEIVSIQL